MSDSDNDSDSEIVEPKPAGAGSDGERPASKFISFADGKLKVVNMPHFTDGARPLRVVIILGKVRRSGRVGGERKDLVGQWICARPSPSPYPPHHTQARLGKSTFLNCIAMRLSMGAGAVMGAGAGASVATKAPPAKRYKKSDAASAASTPAASNFQPPFRTSDRVDHCTMGIDSYLVTAEASGRPEDILLLDCQGLAMGDSSHDPVLLLATYLLGAWG